MMAGLLCTPRSTKSRSEWRLIIIVLQRNLLKLGTQPTPDISGAHIDHLQRSDTAAVVAVRAIRHQFPAVTS